MESFHTRSGQWMIEQKLGIEKSLTRLLTEWELNKPLEKLDISHKKKASFVLETVMATYGLNFSDGVLNKTVAGFYPHLDDGLKGSLTENHNSLAVKIKGDGISTPVKYAPVLSGDLEIGSASPLKVGLASDSQYSLSVEIGDDVAWQLGIEFIQPPSHATMQFESTDGDSYFGKRFADACTSINKGGFILVDSGHPCEQGCSFCTYEQGHLKLNPDNFSKLEQVLDFIATTTGKITACFSSGSALSADRGIASVFPPMLEIVNKLKTKYPHLKVELELEIMPWEIEADGKIISFISEYYQKGYIKAINMNLETPIGVDRSEFMNLKQHGKANIPVAGSNGNSRGYLEAFQFLKERFPELQLAGLILFGLKPITMDWPTYLIQCLKTVEIFAKNGVKALFQPLKISSKTSMAAYPLVDIFWLTGGVLLADVIHMKYGLESKHRVGCVNGCDACDPSRSGYSVLRYFQSQFGEEGVKKLLSPWLKNLKAD